MGVNTPPKSPSKSPSKSPRSPVGSPPGEAHAAPIGVDPAYDGTDDEGSSYEDDGLSSTASVASSILKYREMHGRTYHNYEGAEYWGPNDDRQNEGLDVAHNMFCVAFDGKLYHAPLDSPQKVLDVGTGTGIWAIDFADENPSADVIGTDISPIQPAFVPPNCRFELDNCELDWTYPDNTFDYIHVSGLTGCVQDWPKFYAECLRTLKPGGWLEQKEYALPIEGNEEPLPADCVWHDWGRIFREAGTRMGRSFEVPNHWEKWLREGGFQGELHQSQIRVPIGGWPAETKWKEVGLLNRMSLEQGLEGFASYLCTAVLGWNRTEVEVMLLRVRNAIKNRRYHAFYPLRTVFVQKPQGS